MISCHLAMRKAVAREILDRRGAQEEVVDHIPLGCPPALQIITNRPYKSGVDGDDQSF